MACDGRPVHHFPQLSSASVFLSHQQSDGRRDRCVSPVLGWASGVCLPSVRPHTQRPQQAAVVQGDVSDFGSSSVATEGVVSRTPEAVGRTYSRPSSVSRSTQTASRPSVSLAPPHASSLRVETVQQFARDLGLMRPVS